MSQPYRHSPGSATTAACVAAAVGAGVYSPPSNQPASQAPGAVCAGVVSRLSRHGCPAVQHGRCRYLRSVQRAFDRRPQCDLFPARLTWFCHHGAPVGYDHKRYQRVKDINQPSRFCDAFLMKLCIGATLAAREPAFPAPATFLFWNMHQTRI